MALSREIVDISFAGETLSDTQELSEYQVKVNTSSGSFSGTDLDCIQVKTRVVANVVMEDGAVASVSFDEFPETITVQALKAALAKVSGKPQHSLNMVREYPCSRPIICQDDHRILGYDGEMERGLWKKKPHLGETALPKP